MKDCYLQLIQHNTSEDFSFSLLQTPLSSATISPLSQPDGVSVSRYSVANSQSSLIHSVQPSDCTSAGFVLGGVTMKMMDEVAGIVAFRHCKSNVVTASIGKFLVVLGKENKTSIAGNNLLSTLTSYMILFVQVDNWSLLWVCQKQRWYDHLFQGNYNYQK